MNSIRQASRSAPLRKKHEAKKLKRKLKIDLNNLDVDITISKENNAYVVIVWHLLKVCSIMKPLIELGCPRN
jgi:hypothetical protein